MKKLFSIILVIALAVSCLAVFPSAAEGMTEDSYHRVDGTVEGNILTFTYTLHATIIDPLVDMFIIDWFAKWDPTQLKPIYDPADPLAYVTYTGVDGDETNDVQADNFWLGSCSIPYDDDVIEDPNNRYGVGQGTAHATITIKFEILAAPGTVVSIYDDESMAGCGNMYIQNELGTYTFTVPEAETEAPETEAPETEAPETEAPETEAPAPTYEEPAKAEYQTLAGCEACGREAGVRFIATVDAAADVYGMEISANGITRTLSSTDAGFKTKAETADTITFTAVIFSDLTFEVVVFETYGDVTVKSEAGTN